MWPGGVGTDQSWRSSEGSVTLKTLLIVGALWETWQQMKQPNVPMLIGQMNSGLCGANMSWPWNANKLLGVWVRSHIAKVGSLWTNHCPTPATDAVPQKVRRRILPPLVWHGRGKLDIMDRYFSRLFGETFQQHIVAWFDSIWDLAEEVRWVSFAQLFVLYRLQTGAHGVIKLGGKWHVFLEGGEMTPEQFRFSRRCKGFRLMLQALFKAGKLQVHTCTTRPVSQYLLCHIGCLALPLKSLLHDKVEWWLGNNLLRPIRGGSTNLELPRM